MKIVQIAILTLTAQAFSLTISIQAQNPPASNGFDEFLNFNDNLVPPGWQVQIFGGSFAGIINKRFQIDQVDTYAALTKDKSVPAGTTAVSVSFRTVVNDIYWGAGSQPHLIMQDGSDYYVSVGKAGYGDPEIRVYAAIGGTVLFDQYYPPDYGEYLLSTGFRNGQISFTVLKKGNSRPLVSQTVAASGLKISKLKTIWLYGLVTTGISQWIDDASITATNDSPSNVLYGIDVSRSQSSKSNQILWESVWGSNHVFALVKSSEGMDFMDNRFRPNIDGALAAGVIAAPYHVGRPDEDLGLPGAQAEADYFLSVANDYLMNGHLRPVLDIETDLTGDISQLPAWIDAWMGAVRAGILANTGQDVPPILYASRYVINSLPASLTQYPVWVADRNTSKTRVGNILPWSTWSFHQYLWGEFGGACPGVTSSKGCDLDVFNGTFDDLNALILDTNP